MKKGFEVLLVTMFMTCSLFSQDLIIKKDGEEINSKIVEIGIDSVKFKKNDNIEGPDYVLHKYDIVFVKLENGTKEIFNVNKPPLNKSDRIRKGVHLGFHVAPAYGTFLSDYYEPGFTYNFGLDLNIYFNNYIGIKTGLAYNRTSINYTVSHYFQDRPEIGYTDVIKGEINSVGIPVKLLVTTGKKIGVYMEFGLVAYFVISNVADHSQIYKDHTETDFPIEIPNHGSFLAEELVVGINWRLSKGLNVNFGAYNHYPITNVLKGGPQKELQLGLQLGVLFYLKY